MLIFRYIKRVNIDGGVEHLDWTQNFLALRRKIGIEWPGYMYVLLCITRSLILHLRFSLASCGEKRCRAENALAHNCRMHEVGERASA